MGVAEALESEIKKLIVEALALEDVVLEERYGVTIEDDPEGNARIFASVRSLADFVRTQGDEPGGGND